MAGPLTPTERDMLKLMMLGKSPEDVATILGLHPLTVKAMLKQTVEKLNASLSRRRG